MKYKMFGKVIIGSYSLCLFACGIPKIITKLPDVALPKQYATIENDSISVATTSWRNYFKDPYLLALIDTALLRNQELNIVAQEVAIARFEIRAKQGEYLPSVGLKAGAGLDKKSRYTNLGAMEAHTAITPGKEMPDPLGDLKLAAFATWEVDIWHKLRNAKQAAVKRYLASVEGKCFVETALVAEVANTYYELIALEQELAVVQQNIAIQNNALDIVKLQKQASRVTELAVQKFEAEVFKTKSIEFDLQKEIAITQNKLNYLVGKYPKDIKHTEQTLKDVMPKEILIGNPTQLLENRPDIKQAVLGLEAANLDVKVAKAKFYPSIGVSLGFGIQGFNPSHLIKAPESILYSLAGDLVAPLINKNGIKADYLAANAKQIQAVYAYEQTVLSAFVEVENERTRILNFHKSIELKSQQVEALNQSVQIVNDLFVATRADYMEVLLTQRDALESKFELIETQQQLMKSYVAMYQALGGGWR